MTDIHRRIDNANIMEPTQVRYCDILEFDSIRETGPDIHQALVQIDEEMGKNDFDTLKFLCRDEISGAKLEAASSPLDIFESLKKLVIIDVNNFDFLLECLGRIHRFDLVRKLGFQPKAVKEILPTIKQINSFRVLLMDIADDLDEKEFTKMKFLLSGKIKKRKQKDMETVLELFVFMEQEGLLAHSRTIDLGEILNDISRPDLKNLLDEFSGQETRRREPIFTRNSSSLRPQIGNQGAQPQSPHVVSASGAYLNQERHLPSVSEPRQNAILPRSTPADTVNNETPVQSNNHPPLSRAPPIDRSPSAGTISVPSDSSFTEENTEIAEIPEAIFLQIVSDLKDQFSNVGIELGFSNDDIDTYIQTYTDPTERTTVLINTWRNAKLDKGQIVPGLKHVLVRLGCKSAADALQKWIDQLSNSTGQRSHVPSNRVQFEPAAPITHRHRVHDDVNFTSSTGEARPTVTEFQTQGPPQNNYSNLQQAQPHPTAEGITANELLIQQFQRNMQLSVQPLPTNMEHITNEVLRNGQLVNQVPVLPVMPGQLLPGQPLPGQPLPGQGQALAQVQGPQHTTDPSIDAVSFTLPEYKMNSSPRGWCVIINNRDFYVTQGDNESKEMPSRIGTDKDAESLQYVFDKLGFIVQRRNNLTDTEMMTFLVDVAHNVNHKNFDCFVCCILTHGVLSHLYGSNGRLISVKDITATFQTNRCPMLAGKPKLFFLQACQGRDKMSGGEIERDMAKPSLLEMDGDKELIPNEADFLLGYATVPGYVSFRSRNHGSWYIRKLCELLQKHSERHDLMSILVEVNREVSHANAHVDGGVFKQTPAPLVTLRKKLYFRSP